MVTQAVILAGGLGTRLSEETGLKPKPMVEIGSKPILWHIMKTYSAHGISDFIICCGYKGEVIKDYFLRYQELSSDITVNLQDGSVKIHRRSHETWTVTMVNTGLESMTGGRLLAVKEYINDDQFCFTYGDGVGDINITECIKQHNVSGKLATMTVAVPPGRFGAVKINNGLVDEFIEKPSGDEGLINAGYFVLNKECIELIDGPETTWEEKPLTELARQGQLNAYYHAGFWQPMDTLRDKNKLNDLWVNNKAPWKVWN